MGSQVVVVDYGMGNTGSVVNMLRKTGATATLSGDADTILGATKLILPGVGSFDQAMRNLHARGLVDLLHKAVRDNGTPLLGICLGMQLLTRGSEEGSASGIGWIDAHTRRFRFDGADANLRVPHMGWNQVAQRKPSAIFRGLSQDARFYFVHSYFVECRDATDVLATTSYGVEFVSCFERGNLYGAQFHPEKSHRFGMELLRNFVDA